MTRDVNREVSVTQERIGFAMQSDPRSAMFRRVRDTFLTSGAADPADVAAAGISSQLLDSWRRSMGYGLDATSPRPVESPGRDTNTSFINTVDAVLTKRESVLEQSMCGLTLTDADGMILRQWVRDPALSSWLEKRSIVPSTHVDETSIGTSSGICLLDGRPRMIRGLEHFTEDYASVTSAGAAVIHPVTRRVVGSLNLTSRYEDTSPVLLSWVMELVQDIQNAFQESASRRERMLLDAYLNENRDARHPLVALNDQTIITNATAARLLTSVDQALLWEHASRAIRNQISTPQSLVLTDGTAVSVQCREVTNATESAGAVLMIRPVVDRHARSGASALPAPGLPGLVGEGPRWRDLCRQASAATGAGSVLIVGERGSGKVAVATAMAGSAVPVTVVDAADATIEGAQAWLQQLDSTLQRPGGAVILRRCDELTESTALAVANLLRAHRDGPVRVFATATRSEDDRRPALLGSEFASVLTVPALRDRLEDLPALLDALTRRCAARLGRDQTPVRWMADAVQALSRLEWRGNISSLETVVLRVLQNNRNGYINAGDLPADVVASASRRKLVGLEQVEAGAIIAALRAAGGNKNRAAEDLGIARSTLYRKIRSLGIDLSTSAF
ncbi:sigma-54-dependent Fis family transcriptional regulator [Gordonia sp. C13]|uniref:sigma-54-dependent Fis family transcriptional regulator n=1 Tax=Gordonia sp. C13 TaxID=2935078 RepID=UPI00200B3ED1|nr:helix-turn-helix domain-containing protein [Gordonia sp. C13]MCK8616698.1 Fis family transcriptional regulator [Gordonia sp. C13]